MSVLSAAEIEQKLKNLPRWQLVGGEIVLNLTFPDFPEAIRFVNRVAGLAEAANHHPDIDIRYNKVRLSLLSHDVGGLTNRDFRLAEKIEAL